VTLFDGLKTLHIGCALLSIGGFTLRGYWMLTDNPRLRLRQTRILPHVIDSLLLASAIAMLVIWQVWPQQVDWLSVKLVALLVYIALGMVALRFGNTIRVRCTAWLLALLVAAFIVSVAYTKNPLGLLAM
jgi:uncharacterized membrane protein SirB2